MMKPLKKALAIAIIVCLAQSCYKKEKTGYVMLEKVFSEFTFKKELEAKLKILRERRDAMLDSMEIELKTLANEVRLSPDDKDKLARFQTNRETYTSKRKEFESKTAEVSQEFDAQIIRQMNQYIKNYGEKNEFRIIYGTNGTGNIMYADSTLDITNEVIAYINAQYKGKTNP